MKYREHIDQVREFYRGKPLEYLRNETETVCLSPEGHSWAAWGPWDLTWRCGDCGVYSRPKQIFEVLLCQECRKRPAVERRDQKWWCTACYQTAFKEEPNLEW